jgi:hypothetical protein
MWLLSGSGEWLHRILPTIPPELMVVVEGVLEAPSLPRTWSRLVLNPTAFGSVLEGVYYVYGQSITLPRPPDAAYTRTLRHILDPVERVVPREVVSMCPRDTRSSGAHLPQDDPLCNVCCRSVFHPNAWVVRRLSSKELARAFDIPASVQGAFATHAPSDLPWLRSTPVKVLHAVGVRFLLDRFRKGDSSGSGTQEVLESTLDGSPDFEFQKVEGALEVSEDDSTVCGSLLNGVRAANPEEPSAMGRGPSKSVRNTGGSLGPKGEVGADVIQDPVLGAGETETLPEGRSLREVLTPTQAQHQPDPTLYDSSSVKTEREIWLQQYNKSVKADDAHSPIHCWDDRVWGGGDYHMARAFFSEKHGTCPLNSIRKLLLRRWVRNIRLSLTRYLCHKHGRTWMKGPRIPGSELERDIESGSDCIWRAVQADWWEWKAGSRLLFWRWPEVHQHAARDGYQQFLISQPPPVQKTPT